MTGLRIAPELTLPIDVAGEAIAILAKRGAGKTNTATVLVEEIHAAGVQIVILDPVGAWWGIRSSADGAGEGLPIVRLGGEHGDVPLEQTAGALIADVVVDTGQSLLLDLSDFPSKAATARFVVDFAERLFKRKNREKSLVHLVLEEADTFAPQRVSAADARMAGAVEQIVRRGRSRGLGLTMVTQRSAVLNKDVLSQADVLIAMRTTSPHDIAAVKLWVAAHGADEQGVIASLPSLETGEAWVWNPERGLLDRVKVRRRQTFDSSSTPKAGERRSEPKAAAAIDVEKLGAEIAATAERARENDPAELRRRLRELEQQAAREPAERVETLVERVEVPVFNGEVDRLEEAVRALVTVGEQLQAASESISGAASSIASAVAVARAPEKLAPIVPSRVGTTTERQRAHSDGGKLGKGERTVLDVLAEYPDGRTYNELAFLAGYSAKASTLGVILSNLRKAALVEPGNQPVRATADGLAAAGGVRDRPTGQALLDQWLRHPRMGEGERRVLLALVDLYPDATSNEELCALTGYSPSASTMGVILSKLRKLGLVEKGARRAAPEFMEAIR